MRAQLGTLKSLFDITFTDVEAASARDATFTMHHAGCFLIGSFSMPPAILRRDRDLVAAIGVDHILLQLLIDGEAWFEAEQRTGRVRTGDILCLDLSRPMRIEGTALSMVNLVVPRHRIRLPPKRLAEAHGVTIDRGAVGQLLVKQLTTLAEVAPDLSPRDIDLAAELVATLASVGLAAATPRDGHTETTIVSAPASAQVSALVTPSLQMVRAYIDRNLASLTLTPDTVGRHFGLSRSGLYRLFEHLGGVADYIRDQRIERAALHLTSVGRGRGGVSRLALHCGFPSEAAFTRAFRQRFGMTPTEAIAAALKQKNEASTVGPRDVLCDWLKGLSQ